MEIIAEFVRRGALVLLLVRVFLLTITSEIASQKVHTPPAVAPPRPRVWGMETRTVGRLGRRAYALRVQLVVANL